MFKLVVFISATAVLLAEGCPTIKSRETWHAQSPKKVTNMKGSAQYVIIHHTDTDQCSTESACAAQVKTIQTAHMGPKRNYDDIGYNFLIDPLGNVYEGRGWGRTGAHAPGYNSKSIGISFIGRYKNVQPTSLAIEAAKNLIACGVSSGSITTNYKLLGHRQTKQTQCPGEKLYEEIKTWPNWSSTS